MVKRAGSKRVHVRVHKRKVAEASPAATAGEEVAEASEAATAGEAVVPKASAAATAGGAVMAATTAEATAGEATVAAASVPDALGEDVGHGDWAPPEEAAATAGPGALAENVAAGFKNPPTAVAKDDAVVEVSVSPAGAVAPASVAASAGVVAPASVSASPGGVAPASVSASAGVVAPASVVATAGAVGKVVGMAEVAATAGDTTPVAIGQQPVPYTIPPEVLAQLERHAEGGPNEMDLAVRKRLLMACARARDRTGVPPAVLAKWSECRSDRTGQFTSGFLLEWCREPPPVYNIYR